MNWGNRLLLTFIVFGAGMCYLVYRSMHTNYELVEKNYYKTELIHQTIIDASKHAGELKSRMQIRQTGDGVLLQMPDEMREKKIEGSVWFYCAYDAARDKKFELTLKGGAVQLFPRPVILPGTYIVKVSWTGEDRDYYTESNLTVL
jgi:hypothetical protein